MQYTKKDMFCITDLKGKSLSDTQSDNYPDKDSSQSNIEYMTVEHYSSDNSHCIPHIYHPSIANCLDKSNTQSTVRLSMFYTLNSKYCISCYSQNTHQGIDLNKPHWKWNNSCYIRDNFDWYRISRNLKSIQRTFHWPTDCPQNNSNIHCQVYSYKFCMSADIGYISKCRHWDNIHQYRKCKRPLIYTIHTAKHSHCIDWLQAKNPNTVTRSCMRNNSMEPKCKSYSSDDTSNKLQSWKKPPKPQNSRMPSYMSWY